jgi:transposase-like protein
MTKRIAPSEGKAQELAALLQGQTVVKSGEEWLSTVAQLATERVLQDALEREQTECLGRRCYERRGLAAGYRNSIARRTGSSRRPKMCCGSSDRRARGGGCASLPGVGQARDDERPAHNPQRRAVCGGVSQRDMEAAWEKSLGQFVLPQSTMRTMTDTRGQEYEAFRTRDL